MVLSRYRENKRANGFIVLVLLAQNTQHYVYYLTITIMVYSTKI